MVFGPEKPIPPIDADAVANLVMAMMGNVPLIEPPDQGGHLFERLRSNSEGSNGASMLIDFTSINPSRLGCGSHSNLPPRYTQAWETPRDDGP